MEGYNRDQRQSHSCEETVKPSIWRIKDKRYLKQNDPKWVYWLVWVEGSRGGFWPNPGMPAIHLVPQPQHASPAVSPLNSTGPLTAINYKLNVNKDWTLSQFKKEEITSLIYTPHICFMQTYFKFLILSWPYEKCTVHVSCFHPPAPSPFPLPNKSTHNSQPCALGDTHFILYLKDTPRNEIKLNHSQWWDVSRTHGKDTFS